MSGQPDHLVLTVNSGSSSIKTSLYRLGGGEELLFVGELESIGQAEGRFCMRDAAKQTVLDRRLSLPDHGAALNALFDWLKGQRALGEIQAVGHRIVHGGPRYQEPQRVTPELLDEVRRLIPFDPLHLPSEVAAIEAVGRVYSRQDQQAPRPLVEVAAIEAAGRVYPQVPQVACFDTAFHRTMPAVASTFALPHRFAEQGIFRYGFHGLSYEYIMEELARVAGAAAARGRVIIAHLGSGASMAAVRDGHCVDTTMGLTPTGGLVMGTRCGDLDPGVLLYLLAEQNLSVDQLRRLLNHDSGLLGLSGISADMRELLARPQDPAAEEAIAIFCYSARKFIGALTAALGGLETLVFTAGIGERSAPIRERICADLGWLGIELDRGRNEPNEAVISSAGSRVVVRVMKTNEELMIARHTQRVLAG